MSDERQSEDRELGWLEAQAAQWQRGGGDEGHSSPEALSKRLVHRHRWEAFNYYGSSAALAGSVVVVVVVCWHLFTARGMILLPCFALLYPALAAYLFTRGHAHWKQKREALAVGPTDALLALTRQLDARFAELRWGQRILAPCVAYSVALALLSMWQAPHPERLLWRIGMMCLVFAGAAYALYVHGPRKLRAERARLGEIAHDLER